MSRKAAYTIKATPHASPKLSAFDLGHVHAHMEKKNDSGKNSQAHSSKTSTQIGTQRATQAEGSDESTTSAGENDAEDSDGNSAKADDESSDTEDPDVIAPPGGAMDKDGHQTGPKINTTASNTCTGASQASHQAVSQAESSDDEAYNGIDLISDSEKDGSDMDHLEERAIVDSEEDETQQASRDVTSNELPATPGHVHDLSDDAWVGLDSNHGSFSQPSDFFDQQFNPTEIYDFLNDDDCNDFSGFPSDFPLTTDDTSKSRSLPSQRRVRFAEPPHSEIEGFNPHIDDGNDMFQDIKHEPTFSLGSIWDNHSDTDSDLSSGYESDYGETTDEDDIPASATARPQALIRRSSASSTKTSAQSTLTPVRKPGQPWGPKLGSWCIDPTKPLAIVDSCGKRLLVCPARRPMKPDRVFEHLTASGSTTANTSPRTPSSKAAIVPNDSDVEQSDFSSQGMVSPMFGPPNALDNVLSGNKFLATSATYPEYRGADMAMYSNMEYDDFDEDDEYENAIKMEDLFNLTSEEDESEAELGESRPSSSGDSMPTADQSSLSLLDHLDPGVVSVFRQNNSRVEQEQKDILQPRSPLRKRKASPPLHAATRRRIMT